MFIDKINTKTKAATFVYVCVCIYVYVYVGVYMCVFQQTNQQTIFLTLLLCLFGRFPKNKQSKKLLYCIRESKHV